MSVSFERLLNVRSAFGATFDSSGRRLYFISTTTGVPGLWSVRLDAAGAWPEPIAIGPERVQFAYPSPRPGRLVFGLDKGGNERTQLHLLDGIGEPHRPLTRQPDTIHVFGDWFRDGRTISYASNKRDERFFDIYLMNVETGESSLIYRHDSMNYPLGFEPGGRRLLLQRTHAPFEHELLLFDLGTGSARSLTASAPPARYQGVSWSPDGRTIFCTTDGGSDYLAPTTIDPESGGLQRVMPHECDVEDLAVSPDCRYLAYALNNDGYSEVYIRSLAHELEGRVAGPRASLCYDAQRWQPTFAWSPDSSKLACTFTNAVSAPDIWVSEVGSPRSRRITNSWDADLGPGQLSEPELVRYPSFDGLQIPAFVFWPPNANRDGVWPAVFYVHGGPESQLRPSFNPVLQYFALRGFVVVAPNVRGSTGYGKAYSHLDDVGRRLDAVRDLVAGAEWFARQRMVHPRKIAVMGASYGGYMVLAALTERPDLWAAGVDIVGIANFETFLERTGPWRRPQREAEYGSLDTHRPLLRHISPIHRLDRIAAPLMVVHGANDPRVPISEAEQIVAGLRGRGRPVEYLRFEDEGHGIVKLQNRLIAYPKIAEFLERHLLGARPSQPPKRSRKR